ncbi:unnamed protein product [Prunus brigantina]
MHNPKLVEIEYLYKFVPIARCDAETIKLLGLCNLKFKGITIQMLFPSRNSIFDEVYKYHIQTVNDGDLDPGYSCDKISPIVTKVHNKSTGMKWIYDLSLIGFPDLGEDMIFLSHWSLGNELKGGDQVIVSMFMRSLFQVNEWGIQHVHEQHQDQEKMMIMIAQQDDNAVPSFLESDLFDDIFGDGDSHYSDEETDKQVLQQGVQNKIQKSTCSCQSYRVTTPEKADSKC